MTGSFSRTANGECLMIGFLAGEMRIEPDEARPL